MEGTAIPAVMVGGLNSDMPGQVVGSIAESIYDTASGNDLLIPQGSRVVGDYDNSVSYGQTRIGVIWKRIIFPEFLLAAARRDGGRGSGWLRRVPR